ncbi:hypothetical protein Tsubulata_017312 [Turnera subulata]|uniref:Pentacotripeptide-repeat region of PRORP domain-containing protein n=1 Tax=Turnera subulata TaxID=218843 RepID=A0A9Q0IZ89_9ROSI|nr:hypothetical protein Tsubulata_017312 [Turnera subulata]
MSLFFTAPRRLHIPRPKYTFSFLHPHSYSSYFSTTSSLSLVSFKQFISYFSAAFHRTPSIPPQTTRLFSSCPSLSTGFLNDPFEFIKQGPRTLDPQGLGLLQSLRNAAHLPSEAEAMTSLHGSGIRPNPNLVCSVIWELRVEWRLALLAFKWGQEWGCVDEKACVVMLWVLGCNRKFNTAWVLIRDLHKSSMNIRRPMFIMIDRYLAANDPAKAIKTFHIMEKFRMSPDEEAYYFLLNALCRHGNIEDAEEFMLVNKKLFPLETQGFNIILNGWCNIFLDELEAKRTFRGLSKYCLTPDATSYTLMISCFSKVGNLFDSLRLYDEMKKRGYVPGREVYNSLIYVLTRENCVPEALKILNKMKDIGLQPDSTAYNSMIRSLCETEKLEQARNILATMMEENVSPTLETYHAILKVTAFEGTIDLLNLMKTAGLGPTGDTFLLVLGKFFKVKEPENALKIWIEMKQYEVVPDLTHYRMLVEGLATCGQLIKAREYCTEMRSNGYSDDPKLVRILKEPAQDKTDAESQQVSQARRKQCAAHKKGTMIRGKKYPQQIQNKVKKRSAE